MKQIRFNISLLEVLKVSRPFSWINTAIPYAAGYLLATGRLDLGFWFGVFYFLFPYNLAMYGVNDIYDYESDIKNPRKDSIEGSILPKSKHPALWFWIGACNLPFLLYFLITGPTILAKVGILTVGFLCVSYSIKGLRFKEIPLLDSINSACHFVGPFVFALLFTSSKQLYWPVIIAFMLWGMASQAFGAIQDIMPDRSSHIKSIATWLGARRTARFALVCYLLASLVTIVAYWPSGIVAGGLLSIYGLNVAFFLKYRSDAQSQEYHRGWQNFLWLNLLVGFWLTQFLLVILNPFGLGSHISSVLAICISSIGVLQLGLTMYNLIKLQRPKTNVSQDLPRVSIIIHAYNQADNVNSTLLAALGQNYPDFEVLFADLGSSDNTKKLAEGFVDDRMQIIELKNPPTDWQIGSWAARELTQMATGELVVSLAADTIMLPNTLSIAVSALRQQKLQLVSLLPTDQNKTLSQKLILNQNHFLLLGAYPAAFLEHNHPSINLAYGGLVCFQRDVLLEKNVFERIRRSPVEDLDLAKQASLSGLKTAFYLASDIAVSQNHADLKLITKQNIRRFYPALHFNMPLTLAAFSFGSFLFITPGVGVALSFLFGRASFELWVVAYITGLIPRLVVAIRSHQGFIGSLLYPVTSIITMSTLVWSMLSYELFKPRWQKRTELAFKPSRKA